MNAITPAPPQADNSIGLDIAEAVRSTAILANLSVSLWSAERTDRKLFDEMKEEKGAVGNAGRAVKNLMCGVDEHLRKVQGAYKAARYAHHDLTLPWITNPRASVQGGPRLLPTALFEKYLTIMSELRNKAGVALDEFINDYDRLVQMAQANLGGMAQATDYPTAQEVRGMFRLSFDFEPIPSGASFRGLDANTTAKLATLLQAKQQRASEAAQAAMWTQVRERVGHVLDRLSTPDTKFKSATVEDVRALLMLLPGWNVTNDARVAEITEDIRLMIEGVSAEGLRKDHGLRRGVSVQAQDIIAKMDGWKL
jgi:hypothetical protein